jgi:hypothetical protein
MGIPPIALGVSQDSTSIPATTPPFLPPPGGGGDPTSAINDQSKKILAAIAQATSRKQAANTAVPMALPQGGDYKASQQIGMNTANPHAWGAERFMGGVAENIKTFVAKKKQDQLLKAEGDWTYLQAALNEKFAAEQSGDPEQVKAAEAKLQSILGDDKKLKNMAKALNQDWLNPEKTTVYGEALKNVAAKGEQKAGAMNGLTQMFKKLIGQNQQMKVQLSEQQRAQMAKEIEAKAPVTTGATTPADLAKEAEAVANLAYAQKQLRDTPDKFEIKPIVDPEDKEGKRQILVAYDKNNPRKPYIEIKSESGEKAQKGGKEFANEGKLEIVAGVPTGRVMHGGRYLAPGQTGYTDKDKEAVNLGMNAYGLSEKDKERLAKLRGSSYAFNKALYTPVGVIDQESGLVGYASMMDLVRNPDKYAPPAEAEKISARESVHGSLKVNFKALTDSVKALPNGLDTKTQAIVALGLRSDDPGFFDTLIVNKIKEGASDETLRYLTNIKVMHEDILVLRTVGGMGQGSDMMRQAMIRTIPGAGTSSVKEALMQLEGAQRTSEALFEGRPKAGPMGGSGHGAAGGTVKMKAPDGTVKPVPTDQVDHYKKLGATVVP